jgi:hypothetical protein
MRTLRVQKPSSHACRAFLDVCSSGGQNLISLGAFGVDPGKTLIFVERGVVRMAMSLADEVSTVRALVERQKTCRLY